nr:MAG: hypothetical protein [Bacteriophage sp.]
MGMNYNTILASLLDGISLALKSGNSNVDAEQFNFLTDAINNQLSYRLILIEKMP